MFIFLRCCNIAINKPKLSKMLLQITRAAKEDIVSIAPLFDAYRQFYKQDTDIAGAINFLTERLTNNESVIFKASINNMPVGFCQLFPIFSSVSMRRTWLLNDLYVLENARGQGIAAALLQKAKEWGQQTNSKWLLLQTDANNKTAQSVYIKNGWQKVDDFFYELPLA
jgi:GNAT superfamily N-acetyltransferase